MSLRRLILATGFAVMGVASPVVAGSCGYDYCWGAVAIGTNGAYGWTHSQFSEQDAKNEAQRGCKGQCNNFRTFYNTCGAIAVADNGAWGFGWHGDKDIAQSEAMSYCMDGGYNCQVRVWSCSK